MCVTHQRFTGWTRRCDSPVSSVQQKTVVQGCLPVEKCGICNTLWVSCSNVLKSVGALPIFTLPCALFCFYYCLHSLVKCLSFGFGYIQFHLASLPHRHILDKPRRGMLHSENLAFTAPVWILLVLHVSLCFGSYTKPCFTTGNMRPINEQKDGDLTAHHFTLCTIKFPITGDVIYNNYPTVYSAPTGWSCLGRACTSSTSSLRTYLHVQLVSLC